jgi:PPOX class probable F420-dependent enzyme
MLRPVRNGLTVDDLDGLLDLPIVAILATHRPDGTILLSPVWHEWRDGGFNLATSSSDVKVRHVTRHPDASIVVAESAPPYRGIEVRCTPRVIPDPENEVGVRLAVRYLGEERGRAAAATIGDDTVLRLEPGTLRVWDFADDQ